MIFSKDKKPSRVGFYWAIRYGRLVAVEVFRYGNSKIHYFNTTDSRKDQLLSNCKMKFGDKIESPTVEAGATTKGTEA